MPQWGIVNKLNLESLSFYQVPLGAVGASPSFQPLKMKSQMHALLNKLMDFEDSLCAFLKTNHLYHLLYRYYHYFISDY